jgi:hypothetical protein
MPVYEVARSRDARGSMHEEALLFDAIALAGALRAGTGSVHVCAPTVGGNNVCADL